MKQQKRLFIVIIGLLLIIHLSSCTNEPFQKIENVGMLVDNSLQEEAWNEEGHKGLLQVGEQFGVDVFVKENIQTKHEIINAIDDLEKKGVNLIFGHSSRYGKLFFDAAKLYPDIHFVYFNGGYFRDNVTSININSYAMGFFSGMVAGKMTITNQVSIIATYNWQQEIEGFYEGVKYENPEAMVHIGYINDWNEREMALQTYNDMKTKNTDVFYAAGHSFSNEIINEAINDDKYSIGYFLEKQDLEDESILTSTIRHMDLLYLRTAVRFNDGLLEGGISVYDFDENIVTFGKFSPLVPIKFREELEKDIAQYREQHLLPHENSTD